MAYDHAQRNDADYYDDQAEATHCDECGQPWEFCQCAAPASEPDAEPPTSAELWAAYNESGNEKDLPF